MSSKKRAPEIDEGRGYDAIIAALVPLKAELGDPSRVHDDPESISRKIVDVIKLVDRLLGSKSTDASILDGLDNEGVAIWNISALLRPTENTPSEQVKIFAFVRLLSYRLIEAGMERRPTVSTMIRVLQLATKTASALTACDEMNYASGVLTRAAKLEQDLKDVEDPNNENTKSKAGAIASYYSSRMEGACKENNESVAWFMLGKAADKQILQYLESSDIESLSAKVLDMGRLFLKSDKEEKAEFAEVAVKWLQQSLSMAEIADRNVENQRPSVLALKRAILRALARAYYLASVRDKSHLSRARETISTLLSDPGVGSETDPNEQQQLRWMMLSILKRAKASDLEIEQGFKDIIAHMAFDEDSVTDILQEFGLLGNPALSTSLNRVVLERALDSPNYAGHAYVDRILLSCTFVCTAAADPTRAFSDLDAILNLVAEHPVYKLDKVATTACQMLLFQSGGRFFQSKQYPLAAEWFLLATHQCFESTAAANTSKCLRKAALSYVQAGQYAKATATMSKCPGNEAATHYVLFLSAAYQGLEDEAIRAIQAMVKAPDFDRKMLLLATKLAHESQMRNLVLAILEGLLKTLKSDAAVESEVEAVTLIRCIIRVIADLIRQPLADIPFLSKELLRHFGTAIDVIEAALRNKSASLIAKDISWLWRTAYNTAVQGCASWDEFQVADLFICAQQLMELYCKAVVGDSEAEVSHYLAMASFASVCGRVFGLRRTTDVVDSESMRRTIVKDIESFLTLATAQLSRINAEDDRIKLEGLVNISYVLEVEQAITESTIPITMHTFEAVSDVLWTEASCPTHVLYAALEAVLKSSIERGYIGRDKFSRWLRAIVTILLSRARPSDRVKAMGYIEQCVEVMKGDEEEVPPSAMW
ncbi:hypothetical protein FRB99_002270 [Tulasnella sp. 403]|nr:hypothetical protein FRB99_002270 [Tulasnella sp. 403]